MPSFQLVITIVIAMLVLAEVYLIVIYEDFFFDVTEGCMKAAPNEARTQLLV